MNIEQINVRKDLPGNQYARKHGFLKKGEKSPKIYNIWRGIKSRCSVPSQPAYKYYGGRGIQMDPRWLEFKNFLVDMYEGYQHWCAMYGEENISIDRIDNDGDYTYDNCAWALPGHQQNNSRNCRFVTYEGETRNVTEWAKLLGMKTGTLYNRLFVHNWSIEKSFNHPV